MKRTFGSVLLCAALACGCSDSQIHVDKIRAALQGLPDDQKARLEESLKDIESSNYVAALKPLRALALTAKLDKDQVKILNDTVSKVKIRAEQSKGAP